MKLFVSLISTVLVLLTGCSSGGSSGGGSSSSDTTISTGVFLDGVVEGLEYNSPSQSGVTDSKGYFNYVDGESVTFKVGNIVFGTTIVSSTNNIITPISLVKNGTINDSRVLEMIRILQTLDSDNDPTNGIKITNIPSTTSIDLSTSHDALDDSEIAALISVSETSLISLMEAQSHFSDTLDNISGYETELEEENNPIVIQPTTDNDEESENENDKDKDEDHEENDETPITVVDDTYVPTTDIPSASSAYTLLAWNDLGMHCFDGSDFSVFSILPPYNNLNAHLIKKDGTSNKHVTSGVTITYEALAYNDKINTSSNDKTNFWNYLPSLFPSATSVADTGLTGNKTPSTTPSPMKYNATHSWWEADGIPIVNRDDDGSTNYYPMVRVLAKDSAGSVLATADVVLPVSDEMDCAACHASTVSLNDAKPIAGWENNADPLKDYKFNILKLHDEKHPINSADLDTLKSKGYNYQSSLYDSAKLGTPILCASCHSSNALATQNVGNAQSLTSSLHLKHANVIDPTNGLSLGSSSNRTSCYSCHPGAATECLRGAMGSAKDSSGNQVMQCQSCHGTMNDVGNTNRNGWLDEPNCQVCHQNAQRYTSALVNGSLRDVLDNRFATNPNTPSSGVSLYRYSTGHGDLQCSSCHGSTHAVFPTSHAQDNIYSEKLQGHSGTVAECTSCHSVMPNTISSGPHGMHTVGQTWVNSHEDVAENNSAQCTTCHGSDYRGSVLSKTFSARTLNVEGKTKSYNKGDVVGCYDCHGREW